MTDRERARMLADEIEYQTAMCLGTIVKADDVIFIRRVLLAYAGKTVEGALLEAERAITARLAGYDPRRDRAAIAATQMAALAVKRLRTGETATEIEPSFVVVPHEPSVFAVARAISTATTHGLITDGGQTYVYAQPTHNSMRAALIEYAEKGND